jgi:NADPH-dependent 2,4-dienoyl-CoA reductase/sulfur reductase-like enzyme/rhodanese-related sulfurtransferase
MNQRPHRLVIIGGVAAGATAAARARRLDESAEIILIDRGRYVSFANCGLPYFISRDIQKRSALLLQTPEGFFGRYRVDVRLQTEAVSLHRAARTVTVRTALGEEEIAYDSLILAQGGRPITPAIEDLDRPNVFKLWTIPDTDAIHAYIDASGARSAVVVGGGFIGLEVAEALARRGLAVSIVELAPHVMPPADPAFGKQIENAYAAAGVRTYAGRKVARLVSRDGATFAQLDDGAELAADVVLLSAGVRPNVELAQAAGLEIGSAGGLVVDDQLRTADPFIWAAGDMIELTQRVSGKRVRVPLAGPANRQGRIAATNALGGAMRYRGALGTSVLKVMDDTFAMTGLSERAARQGGLDVRTATIHKDHHAAYYPGASELSLKLVYEASTGRILGAQGFGRAGVDKRIDVIATALAGNLTIDDLAELDLAYAPPYGSANDPVNMVAYAAQNDRSGYSRAISPADALQALTQGTAVALDVRTRGEHAKGSLRDVANVPLDELRDQLDEVPRGRPLVLVSKTGFEGHLAARLLRGAGFEDVAYVSGGMRSLLLDPGVTAHLDN